VGNFRIPRADLPRLLHDPTHPGTCYQQAFNSLARTHQGQPAAVIEPLLRRAADTALLGFSAADLREQAEAISTGARYELRVSLT
jgi:hypothetical protein